jgi:hypothetical protein
VRCLIWILLNNKILFIGQIQTKQAKKYHGQTLQIQTSVFFKPLKLMLCGISNSSGQVYH